MSKDLSATPSRLDTEKGSVSYDEHTLPSATHLAQKIQTKRKLEDVDEAAEILAQASEPVVLTAEEDRRILRLIDRGVLPVLLLVYFLQQLDKSSLSYTSVFGIVTEAKLVGTQYSWLSSVVYLAQLIFQPVSSYAIVRLPVGKLVFFNVLCWGATVAASSAAHNFKGLLIARLFLGIFEASIAPSFITITQMWWRRREQTWRTASWNISNGVCGMIGSLLSYGIGHISSDQLQPYQIIFLFCGCLTLACTPIVFFCLPDSPKKAKFLNSQDKVIAIERLRDNNMGTESKHWKWAQFWETMRDPKSYLWFAMLFLAACPSGGIGAFGPLIIKGFGFDSFQSILFNIPFGFVQVCSIAFGAWLTNKIRLRFPIIVLFCLFPIAGSIALLKLGRGPQYRSSLLGCYYILSVFNGLQPMLYAWAPLNACGHTKKVTTTAIFFIAQCAGNVVGPQVYQTNMAPRYTPGLVTDLVCWCALLVLACVTAGYLHYLNKQQEKKRVALGKPEKVVDTSILSIKDAIKARAEINQLEGVTNDQAFDDLTDWENEDFVYVL